MLSAFTRNVKHHKKHIFPFYELGRVYTDAEIGLQENRVKKLNSELNIYDTFLKSIHVEKPEDLASLSRTMISRYKDSKNKRQRVLRQLDIENPILKKMKLSKNLPKIQPLFKDIIAYAKSKKKYPLDIVEEYKNLMFSDTKLPFFPDYIISEAQRLRTLETRFKNGDAYMTPLYPKYTSLAIKNEDDDGSIKKLVDLRIKSFLFKISTIKNNQLDLMKDVVRDHLGVKPNKFTNDFIHKALKFDPKKDITDNEVKKEETFNKALSSIATAPKTSLSNAVSAITTTQPIIKPSISVKSGASLLSGGEWDDYFSDHYENSGLGFFGIKIGNPFKQLQDLVKNVQNEVERALKKIAANTIGSKLSKDLLPPELYKAASKLSKASIEIMVGKVSPERIGNALEAVYKISAIGSQSVTWIVDETTGAILSSPVGRQLDSYTGGIISSVDRISHLDNNVIDDKKVNPLTVVMDVVKVAAVVGGAGSLTGALTNVAEQSATNYVGKQSGLNKTALGRSVLSVATGSAGGGNIQDLLTSEAKKVATQEATKQTTKALAPALGKDASTILGSALVTTTTQTYGDSEASYVDTLQSRVTSSTKSLAVKKADAEIKKKTGGLIGIDQVQQIYNLDPKKVTKEAAKHIIDDEVARVHKRILNETTKALNVKERIKHEYDVARAKITDPQAIEKLQAHTKEQIDLETKKLADKIDNVQAEMDKALDSTKGFNLKDEIARNKAEIAENFAREKERFQSMTMNDVFDQAKQYGPDLLRYLMAKYGPKPNYDKVITENDLQNYKTWKPTANIYPPKKGLPKGLLMGGVAAIGAYMVMKD